MLGEVAESLKTRAPAVLDRVRHAVNDGVPELQHIDDPDLSKACRRAFGANVHAVLNQLRGDVDGAAEAPLAAVHHAVLWARQELPFDLLLRGYGVGQQAMLTEVLRAIEERGVPAELRHDVVAHAANAVLESLGATLVRATAAHDAERRARTATPLTRRVRLIEEVLDGTDRSVALGYELGGPHLALFAWGDDPARALTAMCTKLERPMLLVQPEDRLAWGWIGGSLDLGRERLRSMFHHAIEAGACFAFGTVESGIEGFRTSFERARLAHRFGARCDRPLTVYSDIALEALCLRDEEHARSFTREQLGALAAVDAKSVALRATLTTYFAKASNAASCAVALGVHEGTVAYRLKSIEKLLGHPIADRRAELEIALRLARVLAR